MRRLRSTFALLVSTVALVAGSAQPSNAASYVRTYDAATGETNVAGINMSWADTYMHYNTKAIYVQLQGTNFSARYLRGIEVYLDTSSGNQGPEYRIHAYSPYDPDKLKTKWLARVENWGGSGTRIGCSGLAVAWSRTSGYVQVTIPRGCVGKPGSLRVNVETWRYTAYNSAGYPTRGYSDVVPSLERWSSLMR